MANVFIMARYGDIYHAFKCVGFSFSLLPLRFISYVLSSYSIINHVLCLHRRTFIIFYLRINTIFMKRCKVFLFSQLSPDNYFIIPKRKASFDFILLDFGVILVVKVKNYKSNCIEKC